MIWQNSWITAGQSSGSAGSSGTSERRPGTSGRRVEPRDGDHDSGQEECHIENVMENIITRMDLKKIYGAVRCVQMQPCCADVKALILTKACPNMLWSMRIGWLQ